MPKVIQVIESEVKRGLGRSENDPVRSVRQYHSLDGDMLAEDDPCEGAQLSEKLASAISILKQLDDAGGLGAEVQKAIRAQLKYLEA